MPPQWAVGRPKPYLGQTPSAPFPTIGPKSKWAYPGLPEPTEKGGGSGSHREGGGGKKKGEQTARRSGPARGGWRERRRVS